MLLKAGVVPHVVDRLDPIRWTGPDIGAHNHEVRQGLPGMIAAEIDRYRAAGVN